MAQKRPPPKILVERDENYKAIIQSGIYGGHRPGFFEWVVYTDEMVADDSLSTVPPDPGKITIKRTLQFTLIATPFEAKSMASWLTHHIEEYEKTFGKIPTPEDLGKKAKELPPGIIT
jgi:hypothetical protein